MSIKDVVGHLGEVTAVCVAVQDDHYHDEDNHKTGIPGKTGTLES